MASFRFEHSGKRYWAKQMQDQTEIYLLEKKGLAELVFTLINKPSIDDIKFKLRS